jgi:hypothetical protein
MHIVKYSMGQEDGGLNHEGGHKFKGCSLIPMDWGVFNIFLNNVCLLKRCILWSQLDEDNKQQKN